MIFAPEPVQNLVDAVHRSPQQVVIAFAGAGSLGLAWLHSRSGSSRTVLEAVDCYAPRSLTDFIGYQPAQFTGPDVAAAMATQAFIRANELADPSTPVAGIGCTATIATGRTKRGQHRASVALCTAEQVVSFTLSLAKGTRSRTEEETVVSWLLLLALAEVCGLENTPHPPLTQADSLARRAETGGLLDRLLNGEFQLLVRWPESRLVPLKSLGRSVIYSGAFNPLHNGHLALADAAAQRLQQQVFFELPLTNADKAPISIAEARQRMAQFKGVGPVLLTRAPLFSQKAQLFPHSWFVIGVDTAVRLVEPRFYGNDASQMLAAFDAIRQAGCQFLVAGRKQGNQFLSLSDVAVPAGYGELFAALSEQAFRADVSSTELRNSAAR